MKKLFIPPVYLLIGFIFIVLFYYFIPRLNVISFPYNLGGLLIAIPGFACMGATSLIFRKHRTTLFIQESSCMITGGLFGKTRNPMYIGMFMALLGFAVCSMNLLSLAVPFGFIAVINKVFIPVEEKLMLKTFGQDYIRYKNRVRRWI
jgi:protein-S-isoprenylcysteine O-methyltransferase Ste14